MKNLVFLAFLLGAGFVGAGLYQGWFSIEKADDGKSTHISVKIDNDGFAKSKAEFLKSAQDRLRSLADEIEQMRSQTATTARAPGNTNESGAVGNNQEALNQLLEQKKAAEKQIDAIKDANSDNFNEVKSRANGAIDDLRTGFRGAKERFARRRDRSTNSN